MKFIECPTPAETAKLDTAGLRDAFLLEGLFQKGELNLVHTAVDRAIIGAAVPSGSPLKLDVGDVLRSESFCERRELGVLNMGSKGTVTVDGTDYELEKLEMVYVGRGSMDVSFASADASSPACFYLVSYPAHTEYPTRKATQADAREVNLGSSDECNERTLWQYIHEDGVQSCQLVMGWTDIKPGSVWNTMPAHLHYRRSEIYCYFDVADEHAVLHLMGKPEETRSLWIHDKQAVISPPWSIHSGAGTGPYRFCWAMGGENQAFADMDKVEISSLR